MKSKNKYYVDGTELCKVHNDCNKVTYLLLVAKDKRIISDDIVIYNLEDINMLCNYKIDKYILYDKNEYVGDRVIELYNDNGRLYNWFRLKTLRKLPKSIYYIKTLFERIYDSLWLTPHTVISLIDTVLIIIISIRYKDEIITLISNITNKIMIYIESY